jgi:multiple sugar transport system substrate-binding protein
VFESPRPDQFSALQADRRASVTLANGRGMGVARAGERSHERPQPGERETEVKRRVGTSSVIAVALTLCLAQAAAAADLVIWWTKGITPEEDEALAAVVAKWEEQSGKTAELSFYGTGDTDKKVIAALEAGAPPDISFDYSFDLAFSPTWAYQGRLADVGEVIAPIEDRFQTSALESVRMLNGETGERAYYALPWTQMTPHVHYWKDLLQEAGFSEDDIPNEWQPFFDFWCEQVQPALRDQGQRIYGLGLGTGTSSNDPFFNIHIFLNAFGAEILDQDGNLQIDDPEVRARVIQAVDSFVKPTQTGCVPPDAVNWGGADDNVSFLNRKNLVAFNPTLSIPASQLKDSPDNYYENMGTRPWPAGPDGKPTPAMVSVKQVLIFEDSPNKANALEFMALLLEPDNIGPMLKGSLGRFFPVMPALLDDPFYTDPADPHRNAMYRQFTETENLPFLQARNFLYAKVMAERLWGKAMGRILLDGWSTEDAVDELALRMKELLEAS